MFTRWYAGYRRKLVVARCIRAVAISMDLIPSPHDQGFIWPSIDLTRNSQLTAGTKREKAVQGPDGLLRLGDRVWIPRDSTDLKVQRIVAAHCGTADNRGAESTTSALKEDYVWNHMNDDVKAILRSCLHCLVAKTGHRIPRPMSITLHTTTLNEVLHFDFLYMGAGNNGLNYVLVLRDDLSSYLWLKYCASADAETAANEISRWIKVFTAMQYWVSDQASHFKNQTMSILASVHRIKHELTVAYSPWINGSVERCKRTLREACTALLSELHIGPQDWPQVLNIVMISLNTAPLPRLGRRSDGTYRTPLEVMTGIKPVRTYITTAPNAMGKERRIEAVRAR